MRPAFLLLLILSIGLTMIPPTARTAAEVAPSALPPDEVFEQVSHSVFVVEGLGSDRSILRQGSGVAIAQESVVTNRHVVAGAAIVRVRQAGRTWDARVAHRDPKHDLVQLRVPGLVASAVPLRQSTDLRVGERVYAVGAPQGLELSLSEGLISGLRLYEGQRFIQTTAPISAGSSGGGLFDARGQLVGITTFYVNEGQNLNFAFPVEWAVALRTQPGQVSVAMDGPALPGDHKGWFARGMSAWAKEDYGKAASAFREALRLKPDDARAWNWLGSTYHHQGKHADAVAALLEAVRVDPTAADPWAGLGDVYRGQGQVEQAITAYRTAVQLDPEDQFAWRALITTCRDSGRTEDAVAALSESLRARPDISRTWSTLGALFLDEGRNIEALAAYQQALRLKPNDALAWYGLGRTYAFGSERARVIEVYQKLKDLRSGLADDFFRRYVRP